MNTPKNMSASQMLRTIYHNHNASAAALILRIVLAALFVTSAWMKLADMPTTVGFFAQEGFTSFQAYLVAWTELVGGVLILVGFLNKPATLALSVIMAVVIWGTTPQPYNVFFGHNYEFMVLTMLVALYFVSPGRYSVAHWLRSRRG